MRATKLLSATQPATPSPTLNEMLRMSLPRSPWAAFPNRVRRVSSSNMIEQAFVLGDGPVLTLDELPPELVAAEPAGEAELPRGAGGPDLKAIQRQQLLDAIRATGGRRDRMAERLGISRATLYRRLKEHGLIRPSRPPEGDG